MTARTWDKPPARPLRRRVGIGLAATAFVGLWALADGGNQPEDTRTSRDPFAGPERRCETEDELLVELRQPGFGHEPGELVCFHIDVIDDAPSPKEEDAR